MDVWKEKRNIENKIKEKLAEKNPDYRFDPYDLTKIDNKDEDYFKALESFKYLYHLGGDAHIYLWNEMWLWFNNGPEIDETDYTKEELDFIRNIAKLYSKESEKYGEYYNTNQNINVQLESSKLLLKSYNEDLNNKYQDFFSNNHNEYELFYGKEFDDYELRRCCNQAFRPLGFAIIDKANNEFVGSIALELMRSDCLYNIEYYILPKYRKNGYAYEAVTILIEAAKNNKLKKLEETIKEGVYEVKAANIKCIEARISDDNIASISLVKKCGFELMGRLPYFDKVRDVDINALQYDLML